MSDSPNLSDARYLAALLRLRSIVSSGVPLKSVNELTGNRTLACTWGLCSNAANAWPYAEDMLDPDRYNQTGYIGTKYRTSQQLCPLDTRDPGHTRNVGCFYHCRIFKNGEKPERGQVIQWYSNRITQSIAHQGAA